MVGTRERPTRRYITIDHPWFCSDLKPIYRWTFPSEATNEELTASFRAREDFAVRVRYQMAWVIDMSNIEKVPALQRKAVAEHVERFGQYGVRYNAGTALIVPSPWLRGVATAVTWLSRPRFPYQLFANPLEAEAWAKEQLAQRLAELEPEKTLSKRPQPNGRLGRRSTASAQRTRRPTSPLRKDRR